MDKETRTCPCQNRRRQEAERLVDMPPCEVCGGSGLITLHEGKCPCARCTLRRLSIIDDPVIHQALVDAGIED